MSANRLKLNTDKTKLLWIGSKYNLSGSPSYKVAVQFCGSGLT